MAIDLRNSFGDIDIYLFDQLLKGRIVPGMKILDVGCGSGRNLIYFLKNDFEIYAIDKSSEAVECTRELAATLAPELPTRNFRVEKAESLSWPNEMFDVVLSSAVLHFAQSEEQWRRMMEEMWRVLKPGGIFFSRLASSIGIESLVVLIGDRRFRLPDGTDRFLVDEQMLTEMTGALGATFLEPIKTTIVQNMRAMTTWCLRKNSSG